MVPFLQRKGARGPNHWSNHPKYPASLLEAGGTCVERERSRQGAEHTTCPLLSLIFEKSTILSAGNSWGQADAFGSGKQSSHTTHLLQQKLPVGKRGALLEEVLFCASQEQWSSSCTLVKGERYYPSFWAWGLHTIQKLCFRNYCKL